MATIIKSDQTKTTIDSPSFADLQKAVEGYVEFVRTLAPDRILAVNEEGGMTGLPINPAASELAGQRIVGNVVVLSQEEIPK